MADSVYIAQLGPCQVYEAAVNPGAAYAPACQPVQQLVAKINVMYAGTTSAQRLAWLKQRQKLLLARAAVIQGVLTELGATDVKDAAQTIGGLGGAISGLFSAIPGIGGTIGTFVGLGTQLVSGLFDKTAERQAAKAAEIARWQADYTNLKRIYDEQAAEVSALMLPRYVLYATAGLMLLALVVILFKHRTR